MNDETHAAILKIDTEEDLMKFNKFEFKNPYKLRFDVLYTSAKNYAKFSNYTNALQAFRSWHKKSIRFGHLPIITVRTRHGDFDGSTPLDFDARSIDGYAPFQTVLAYQNFLDKVTEYVTFLEESHPEVL